MPLAAGFLDQLDADAVAELRALGVRHRYPAGSTLFFEGDPGVEALVVLDGEVKIAVASRDGHEVIVDVLSPGALVGELSALDGLPRSASAVALGPVEVLAIPRAAFAEFFQRHPLLLFRLVLELTGRLRSSTRRSLEFGTGDALGRLSGRLLELSERYGAPGPEGTTVVALPVSQTELASWTGLSREAVVKALRALRSLGWVTNQGRTVTILRPDQLRQRATQ